MQKPFLFLGAASLLVLAWACGGGNNCPAGLEGCGCAIENDQPTCGTGLSCVNGICVNPSNQNGSGGGNTFDETACRSCWESQCSTEVDACEAAASCSDLSDCLLGCFAEGGEVACYQSCTENAQGADAEALTAYGNLQVCVATSCSDQCIATTNPGTGGGGNGTGGGNNGTGGDITFLDPTRELRPLDGWVHIEENTVGIQGPIYAFSDQQSGTFINLDSTGRSFCVSGTTTTVPCLEDECFGIYWGAGAGMNLNELPDSMTPGPYDASTAGVTGIAFTISGSNVPFNLRFKAVGFGDSSDYCVAIGSGAHSISFSSLQHECWDPIAGGVDQSQIEAIQWQIFADQFGPISFDFCINDIRALP